MRHAASIVAMHRAVIFDLYGTLLVADEAADAALRRALYDALDSYGLRMSFERFSMRYDRARDMPVPRGRPSDLTPRERWLHRFLIRLGLVVPLEALRAINEDALDVWGAQVRLDPDALDVLGALHAEKRLALVADFDHPPHARQAIESTGLASFFEAIILTGDIGIDKQDWTLFMPAIEAMEVRPSEVIYVGDTVEDVLAARRTGLVPILVDRGREPIPEEAFGFLGRPATIRSLSELLASDMPT